MFFNTHNNILTLKDFRGIKMIQSKNPISNEFFESEEDAARWLFEYMSNQSVVLFDIDIQITHDDNSAHIKIIDNDNILPENLIIYITNNENYELESIQVKQYNMINLYLRRLNKGKYYIDIEEFTINNITYILLINEKYNSFTIE